MGAPQFLRSVDSRSPAVTQAVALVAELARQRTPVGIAEPARSLGPARKLRRELVSGLTSPAAQLARTAAA